MKQHITAKQIGELTNKQYNALNKLRKERITILPFEDIYEVLAKYFTIGKMIEILCKKNLLCTINIDFKNSTYKERGAIYRGEDEPIDNLCDHLWGELKYNL